jgi:hypothetical protein
MPLVRSPEQKRATLDEFYAEIAGWSNPGSSKGGTQMRRLIKRINEALLTTGVWGLTSHAHLLLHATPDYAAPWFVSVVAYGDQIVIEYKLPANTAPWKDAVVRGVASDIETALMYVKIAMLRSGGWPQCSEMVVANQTSA